MLEALETHPLPPTEEEAPKVSLKQDRGGAVASVGPTSPPPMAPSIPPTDQPPVR